MRPLTEKQILSLRAVAWGVKHFDGLTAGGISTTRRLESLKRRGLVEELPGLVTVCDGDGFALQPERHRVGWRLTAEGKRVADGL